MSSSSQSSQLVAVLRRHLRQQGWTARRLAAQLGIGEATAKRWMAGRGLSLPRLEQLAGLCGLTLAELAQELDQPGPGLAHELTLGQERALAASPLLSFVFVAILGGHSPGEIALDFSIPADMFEAALARLERLALIDRLPEGRARARVDRKLVWRKAPMRALFEARMKAQYFEIDYSAPETTYASELVKLSPRGAGALAELIETYRRAVQDLCEQDRRESHLPGTWYTTLCVARPLGREGFAALIEQV